MISSQQQQQLQPQTQTQTQPQTQPQPQPQPQQQQQQQQQQQEQPQPHPHPHPHPQPTNQQRQQTNNNKERTNKKQQTTTTTNNQHKQESVLKQNTFIHQPSCFNHLSLLALSRCLGKESLTTSRWTKKKNTHRNGETSDLVWLNERYIYLQFLVLNPKSFTYIL